MARILLTTSHRPSQRTRSFVKDLAVALAGERFSRGKASQEELLTLSSEAGYTRLLIVDTYRGNPSRIRVYRPPGGAMLGSIRLRGVKLLRECRSSTRFRPRGVVLYRAGYPHEDELAKLFDVEVVGSIGMVPPKHGLVILEDNVLRFIHPTSMLDYGPVLFLRGVSLEGGAQI